MRNISVFLPIGVFVFLSGVFSLIFYDKLKPFGKREAICLTSLALGVYIAIVSEILSLFGALNFNAVIFLWGVPFFVLGIYCCRQISKRCLAFRISLQRLNFSPIEWIFVLILLIFVSGTLTVALFCPPNNWDSMTYHMARVMYWIQGGSINYFPTNYPPQVYHPPLGELIITQFQILSGEDYFANLVQWFSMILSLLAASLIAKIFGAGRRGQLFSMLIAVTIPMGILQSSTTQNDYIVAYWILCSVYFLLRLFKRKEVWCFLGFGVSAALAFYTKASAYVILFPFFAWLFVFWVRYARRRWLSALLVILPIVLINSGYYHRNQALFGSPISAPKDFQSEYRILYFSPETFLSNFTKNAAMHADIVRNLNLQSLVTPTTGKVGRALDLFHEKVLNVDINDPRITWGKFSLPGLSCSEDTAGNPIHFHLIILGVFMYFFMRRPGPGMTGYLWSIFLSFCFFSLLLKWQPYQVRHHLVYFLLMAPAIGTIFDKRFSKGLNLLIAGLLFVSSLQFVLFAKNRMLIGDKNIFDSERTDMYFNGREWIRGPFNGVSDFIDENNIRDIGLDFRNDHYEYPLWVLLEKKKVDFRIKHVNVLNETLDLKDKSPELDFVPEAIVSFGKNGATSGKFLFVEGFTYSKEYENGPLCVYMRKLQEE